MIFIYVKFKQQPVDLTLFEWSPDFSVMLLIIILLMPLNWMLEALRWKISLSTYEPISFLQAGQIVLSGLALSWILPFTSGDLAARLWPMNDKYKTIAAMLLNRGIMLGITLIFGLYGVFFFSKSTLSINAEWIMVAGVPTLFVIIFFRKKMNTFLSYFKQLHLSVSLSIISLSLLRFFVFTLQFFLILYSFIEQIPFQIILAGIGWIFLVRSSLPIFLGGIGIRETSGILFFSPYLENTAFVVIPIFIMWIINVMIPSLIGFIPILKLKMSSEKLSIARKPHIFLNDSI